jgi:PncC family amidohydrolase
MQMEKDLVAEQIKEELLKRKWSVCTCESMTAGMVASALGDIPGISEVLAGGLVTYMTKEKHILAGVPEEILNTVGAVSEECAAAMASGAAERMGCEACVSVTGNAGPTGMENKEDGLVYIGTYVSGKTAVREYHFSGSRQETREAACLQALKDLLNDIRNEKRP